MTGWNECESCEEEFSIVGGSLGSSVAFCPFCGEPVEEDEDDEEDEEDFDEDE